MKLPLIFSILILLCACQDNSSNTKSQVSESKLAEKSTAEDNHKSIDIEKFKYDADSIISDILGTPIAFTLQVDTVKPDSVSLATRNGIPDKYIPHYSQEMLLYHFKLNKPYTTLSLNLYEAAFSSTEITDSVFSHLRYLSFNGDAEDETVLYAPGLTYSNDYLIKQEKTIVWLHSGCVYSFANHTNYAHSVRRALNKTTILDSVQCQCGNVMCL